MRLEIDEKPQFPKMKWAQSRGTVYIGIEVFNMKVHRLQMGGNGSLHFFGVSKPDANGKTHVYEFNEELFENIVHEKSGSKVATGYLQLYLKKVVPEMPPYPPPNYPTDLPPPPKVLPHVQFWPFIFKSKALQKSPRITVDWDRW